MAKIAPWSRAIVSFPLAGSFQRGVRIALMFCAVFQRQKTGGLVKLSTLRTVASCVLFLAVPADASQTVALTLSPVEPQADNTFRLKLFLNSPSKSAPAGLQWIFRLPPGLDIVGIEAGKAVKEAGKTLVCNGPKCIVYGMNRTTISSGPIAVLKIKVDQSLAGGERSPHFKYEAHGRARTRRPEVQIGDPMAVSLDGKAIPVVPGIDLN